MTDKPTEEEIQKEFREKFDAIKKTYADAAKEGMSGIGGYTTGPCTESLVSMDCARLDRCVCRSREEKSALTDAPRRHKPYRTKDK